MVVRTAWSSSTINSVGAAVGDAMCLYNYRKARTFSGLTGHVDAPAVVRHNLLDNRQSDAGSDLSRSLGALGAVELLEDALHFFRVHADPLVLHRQPDFAVVQFRIHVNMRLRGGIFDGIGQQIV